MRGIRTHLVRREGEQGIGINGSTAARGLVDHHLKNARGGALEEIQAEK